MCLIIIYTEVCLEKQLASTFLTVNDLEWDAVATLLFVFTVGYATIEVQENHRKMDTTETTNYCMPIKISEEHWNRVKSS